MRKLNKLKINDSELVDIISYYIVGLGTKDTDDCSFYYDLNELADTFKLSKIKLNSLLTTILNNLKIMPQVERVELGKWSMTERYIYIEFVPEYCNIERLY